MQHTHLELKFIEKGIISRTLKYESQTLWKSNFSNLGFPKSWIKTGFVFFNRTDINLLISCNSLTEILFHSQLRVNFHEARGLSAEERSDKHPTNLSVLIYYAYTTLDSCRTFQFFTWIWL